MKDINAVFVLVVLFFTVIGRGYAENFFSADSVRCYPGLINIFEVGDRYYWQVADSLYGRDFLVTTTLLKGAAREKRYSEQHYGYAGDRLDVQIFRIIKQDGKLLFIQPFMQDVVADTLNELTDILRQRGEGSVVAELEIKTEGLEGALVEVTDLLKSNDLFFGLSPFEMELGIGTYLPQSSYLKEIKVFERSLVVRFVRNYMSVNYLPDPAVKSEPTRWEYGVSLCLLPESPMRGRRQDARIGYFSNTVREYRHSLFNVENVEFISRWRMEPRPEDKIAYIHGELVEPMKPIVYYIDRDMPKWLQPYVKKAVEAWLPAFEQAGFKNAIQAYLEPTLEENPEFSVDNALFSYISYKASPIANAYGPSSVDPRSGEILCSHIGVYNSIAELVQGLYFCQAGVIDSLARRIVLPDTLLGKLIQYVVCHEVGHALGLKHNFWGSSVFSVEQIRDRDFVHQNGYGASIMDYMRFNYAAQPEDGMNPEDLIPRVGAYDCLAIAWGYRYFPEMTVNEEEQYLREWLDEKGKDPLYRYNGTENTDVLSQSEDLGNNQMQTNALGIKNMQRLMKLNIWQVEDDEMARLVMGTRYQMMIRKFYDYVDQALMNIRGRTEKIDTCTGNRRSMVAVSKQRQKEALAFLDEYVCDPPQWLFRPDLFCRFQIDERLNMETVFMQLVNSLLSKLKFGSTIDYTQEEFLSDIRHIIFKEWETGEQVGEARKILQRLYIKELKKMATADHEDYLITLWTLGELDEILQLAEQYVSRTEDKGYAHGVINSIKNWKMKEQ